MFLLRRSHFYGRRAAAAAEDFLGHFYEPHHRLFRYMYKQSVLYLYSAEHLGTSTTCFFFLSLYLLSILNISPDFPVSINALCFTTRYLLKVVFSFAPIRFPEPMDCSFIRFLFNCFHHFTLPPIWFFHIASSSTSIPCTHSFPVRVSCLLQYASDALMHLVISPVHCVSYHCFHSCQTLSIFEFKCPLQVLGAPFTGRSLPETHTTHIAILKIGTCADSQLSLR